jgi:mRNA interferase RelE/StbE
MAWNIELSEKARKNLKDLDPSQAKRILTFLFERVGKLENPRSLGESLEGPLRSFWKYRVGDYRIICDIEDKTITITALKIGHRREVYR